MSTDVMTEEYVDPAKLFKSDIRWSWLKEKGFNVVNDQYQLAYMQALWTHHHKIQAVFVDASAGTGKTTLAALAGVYGVDKGDYDRIIYVRSTVAVRDQGFLPGDKNEKGEPYFEPMKQAMDNVAPGLYEKWRGFGTNPNEEIKIPKLVCDTTSYTRGVTWDNAFVIIDEAQNLTLNELQTVLTRCTDSSKVVIIGSHLQVDEKQRLIAGLLPFEVFIEHYRNTRTVKCELVTNYRGWFSQHADRVGDTIKRLLQEAELARKESARA
jgi:predicted ribonuclease YlaK